MKKTVRIAFETISIGVVTLFLVAASPPTEWPPASYSEASGDGPPLGAKALFGQGNDEIFFPREGGRGSSVSMNPTARVDDATLGGLYEEPAFPGVAYSLEVIRRGENHVITVQDPRRHEFRTGDRVRMRLVPNFTGHAYVLEAKGRHTEMVYPAAFGSDQNRVIAGQDSYVPTAGWLRLTDPAEPFTMRVLFKPGPADYALNEARANPAAVRVSLTEAVHREWRKASASKGIVFEADQSYIDTGLARHKAPPPAGVDEAPGAAGMAHVRQAAVTPPAAPQPAEVAIDRTRYTTNYVVIDPGQAAPAVDGSAPPIAIEVPIRHIGG